MFKSCSRCKKSWEDQKSGFPGGRANVLCSDCRKEVLPDQTEEERKEAAEAVLKSLGIAKVVPVIFGK